MTVSGEQYQPQPQALSQQLEQDQLCLTILLKKKKTTLPSAGFNPSLLKVVMVLIFPLFTPSTPSQAVLLPAAAHPTAEIHAAQPQREQGISETAAGL